ncbi:MAG: sulfite oxidase [Aestuariivirga sp.]
MAAFLGTRSAEAFPVRSGEQVLPWLDQLPANPVPEVIKNQLVWEDFDSWITPNDKFFSIAHYNRPMIEAANWKLQVSGMVKNAMTLTLDEIKKRPRQEVTFTVECSGNTGLPFFNGGVGNARWAGTPLAPLLKEAGLLDGGIEVVFWGTDQGEEVVREIKMPQNFARSMPLAEAMNPNNILCYEMNGAPLPADNGFPLRLIAPGWYGIANVKWLQRIEVRDKRLMNRFMARDYVTIREENHDGKVVWAETSVGRNRIKSVPARVSKLGSDYRITGAAWGGEHPIARVEVKIDDGPWTTAAFDTSQEAEFAWKIWSLPWPSPTPGDHTVTSRAIAANVNGNTESNNQPQMDDDVIAKKHTYWESNGQVTRKVHIG